MKPVYLFKIKKELIKTFKDTRECAKFFNKDVEYINHNLKYCDKIRKDGEWYAIRRKKGK